MSARRWLRRMRLGALPACAALAGCASIGDPGAHALMPDRPSAGASLAAAGGGGIAPQSFAVGETTPRAWWRQFGCAELDRLVELGLEGNNDIAAADAALRAARAQAAAAGAALAPGVDLTYAAQRTRTAGSLAPPVTDANQLLYSLHTAQVTVTYPLDLFGGLHARRTSARAAAAVAAAHLLAARQTLAATLATAAITRAELADQIDATGKSIAAARQILELMRRRRTMGAAGDADVAAQEAALAALETGLPPLERAEAHQRAVISALVGSAPGSGISALPNSACLVLPARVPVAEPASVVRDRPDVRAAAAAVEGAAADARVAVAARFPSLLLTGSAGGTSQSFADMFQGTNVFWSLIGGITAPLFHAGALRHQQQAATALFEQSKAQYRGVVLQAFVDVADAMEGLQADAVTLAAAERGLAAAERSDGFVRRQEQLGDVGTLALLQAQGALQQARLQASTARAARLIDTVALYQANGQAGDEQRSE